LGTNKGRINKLQSLPGNTCQTSVCYGKNQIVKTHSMHDKITSLTSKHYSGKIPHNVTPNMTENKEEVKSGIVPLLSSNQQRQK